jgi:anti-sigma regulatory factor (Ser/Thr protein kinase)
VTQDGVHDGSITIRIAASLSEIERLNRLVRQFGELHEVQGRALYAMNLAIDELVTNALLYGYEGDCANETVVVEIAASGDELRATLTDTGRPFDPREVPPPNLNAPLEERTLGGLGIHLVRSLMDSVDYRRANDKNVLTVKKRIR